MEDALVSIRAFGNRFESDIACGILENADIPCTVAADDCGGMQPNLRMSTGVRILVPESKAEEALSILDEGFPVI